MNRRERADYIALVDFDYKIAIGVHTMRVRYKKGDKINLRVYGRMTDKLLSKGQIAIIEGVDI